ncbi:MAG: hypothetical protein Q9196_006030, partial [Gyalolechia fulgens]
MAQKEKVMQQLVDILLNMEVHTFDAFGSIVPGPTHSGGLDIQGVARRSNFRAGKEGSLGPFDSSFEAANKTVECYLQMIANGKIAGSHSVDVYLAHRFLLEIVESIWKCPSRKKKFFLMHPDDKGDHIFINESFDITGIVDWEWTQTAPKELAFSSPCMMWPVGHFYDGLNTLSEDELRFAAIFEERGRDDLANYVLQGRKVQRFFFFRGADPSYTDWKTFRDIFTGLTRAFYIEDMLWDEWKAKALEKYSADAALQALLRDEEN